MAAPNIVQVSSIIGVTSSYNHSTTDALVVMNNAASSNLSYKINNVTLANTSDTEVAMVTVSRHLNGGQTEGSAWDNNGGEYKLVNKIGIATATSIVIVDKASSFYLQENESISIKPIGANTIDSTVSYEIISSS